MQSKIKNYELTVTTLSPLHVGSGDRINKKEYIYQKNENKAYIPDLKNMFSGLKKLNLLREYEKYLLGNGGDLFFWLDKELKIKKETYLPWMDYSIDCGDAIFEDRSKKEIVTFIKDAFDEPYIPGSTLKGFIRTAIICKMIYDKKSEYQKYKVQFQNAEFKGRKWYLKEQMSNIESDVFNRLKRNEKRKSDAVNDIMAALRVSDSEPLSTKNLVLCQKLDMNKDGIDKPLNIVRECIKPNVDIKFTLSIDTTLIDIKPDYILKAVKLFYTYYVGLFSSKFNKSNKNYVANSFYFGGGVGYVSKTITYPILTDVVQETKVVNGENKTVKKILPKKENVKMVSKIIDSTLSPDGKKQHKHNLDEQLGVSPHMLKCTRYNGALYEMGLCKMSIKEVN